MSLMSQMQAPVYQQILIAVLVFSSIGATFVNKYVLSVLKFTYPSVYQSWQTGVASFILLSASSLGLVQLSSFERSSVKNWLPAMCLFTVGIYSGSKALSKLPIPIFFSMFHIVHVITTVVDAVYFKKAHLTLSLFSLAMGTVGLVFTIKNDSEDTSGWSYTAVVQVSTYSSAFYSLFTKRIHKVSMREVDKIFLNSTFSVVTLACIGTFSGEVSRSTEFPFLYYNKFHAGCIISGITGASLGLSYSRLSEIIPVAKIRWISAIAMVVMSILSIFIFEFTLSTNLVFSIALCLAGSTVYTYSEYAQVLEETKKEVKINEEAPIDEHIT